MLTKTLHARFQIFDQPWFIRDIVRLAEAVNYSHRMTQAGVPDKVRRKILRRWNPLPYAMRQETRKLIRDMQR